MGRVYVALDVEATGLDTAHDAIIEIAAVKFRDDRTLDVWSTLINPRRPIPRKIQLLTGISQAEVDNAPELADVLPALTRFVGTSTIIGHSIANDLSYLGVHGAFPNNGTLDTFELASILLPEVTRFSLADLAQSLGIDTRTHHRALADAHTTRKLFRNLVRRGLELDLSVLQEINRAAARSQWPLRSFFRDLERERAATAFAGSIRTQLLAKGALDGAALGLVMDRREKYTTLRANDTIVPLQEDTLVAMLSPGGLISSRFPGYEHRPQQIDMLRSVIQAFNEEKQLLVEAGTGTGKSMAYLLPAIHFASQNGQPVVISTNTVNLQDQLYHKDIPDLQGILPFEFRAAVLKGRSNYLCLRRFGNFRKRQTLTTDEVQVLAKVLAWLPVTETGDRAELSLRNQEAVSWTGMQAEQRTCLGERCPHRAKGRCFLYRARRNAECAHVIVVNHALLLSDMMVENRILPEYHHLIVDEAHHLEEHATQQLGSNISWREIETLLTGLAESTLGGGYRGFLATIPQHLRQSAVPVEAQEQVSAYLKRLQSQVTPAKEAAQLLFDRVQAFLSDNAARSSASNAFNTQIEVTRGIRNQPGWSEVEVEADQAYALLNGLQQGLHRLHSSLSQLEDWEIPDFDNLQQEIWARLEHLREICEQMRSVLIDPDPKAVYWADISARDGEVSLRSAPLHVSEALSERLFANLRTVILTSATLRTGRNMRYVRSRLGVEDADEIIVGSPFDFSESTLLYVCTDIPEPNQPNYQSAVAKSVADLCLAIGGNTLVLFTSHHQLRTTYFAITKPLERAGIVVYGQGLDGSRRQLLENFRKNTRSALLGTRSFWEGVDIPGSALTCVVIPRLPFSVPSEPVFAARSRMFEDPFGEYAVPEAVLRFRQGFGRLIRSRLDYGVVAVLDKRILSKGYGSFFLETLPSCTVRHGSGRELPGAAVEWIKTRQDRSKTLRTGD